MTTSADFTLNGTPQSDGVYRAAAGGTVDLALADGLLLDAAVVKVTLERKTKGATDIAELATEYILSPASATLTLTIPDEVASWLIRVQLNGGSSGQGVEPTWTRERVIETVGAAEVAKQLAGERTERHPERGWSDIQNDMVDALDTLAGGGADAFAGLSVTSEYRADVGIEHSYRVSRWLDRRDYRHLDRVSIAIARAPRPPVYVADFGDHLPALQFEASTALAALVAAINSDIFSVAFRVRFPDSTVTLLALGQCPPGGDSPPDGTPIIIGATYTAGANTSITASLSDDAVSTPVVASQNATHSAWHTVIVRSTGSTIRVRVDGTNGAAEDTSGLGSITLLDTTSIGCIVDGNDGTTTGTFDDGVLRHILVADGYAWTDAECLTVEAALTAIWT